VEERTVAIYESVARRYAGARAARRRESAQAFGAAVTQGLVRADLGCGAGRYTADLGEPVVALDAARAMLEVTAELAPGAWPVQADLEHLPLRARSLAGGWASMSYHHLPRPRVPMALAELHRALDLGARVDLTVVAGDYEGTDLPNDDFPGRYFGCWTPSHLADVAHGAGFDVDGIAPIEGGGGSTGNVWAGLTRARTLADTVGPGMSVLVCGLNPSVYSADAGFGFARPGNRFWPAAVAAGLVSRPLDPRRALVDDGVGMTDLVKRASPGSSVLSAEEYRLGLGRVERLVTWLEPSVVCFVGIEGWRKAGHPRAELGVQPGSFGGSTAYVMPSTSGRNAHARLEHLVEHFRQVRRLADRAA
jgi:TDG/mug DNA glycosylase family protein